MSIQFQDLYKLLANANNDMGKLSQSIKKVETDTRFKALSRNRRSKRFER